MEKLRDKLQYYHLFMMGLWPLLAIPTMLWWKDSVVWVAILSLYANFAGEFSGWHAARTEKMQKDNQSG
jgi:hypothetical protein